MITNERIEIARTNWLKASLNLFFKLDTPYFVDINGNKQEVFAFLHEYGAPNGTIICLTSSPQFVTDREIIQWAKEKKIYCSYLNIEDFQIYNEDYFKEILDDWMKCENSR